jgi:hypoxanthine phosphoribosyltransferase
MSHIQLHTKNFRLFLSKQQIAERIAQLSTQLNADFIDKQPLFLGVLNGAFMFCSDLLKEIQVPCELSFVKLSSYKGIESTGIVKELVGLNEDLSNRHVILVEDIVDTGNTLRHLRSDISIFEPASVSVVSLLFKPSAFKGDKHPEYVGFEIDDRFVVGYGLDFNGLGRNLPDIYQLSEN